MELKNQVVSLELAQKLKKLGVKQDSHYFWHFNCLPDEHLIIFLIKNQYKKKDLVSAFTVAELGEMLPHDFKSYKCVGQPLQWECSNDNLKWHCDPKKGIYREAMHDDTEAGVRAKMLIYLLENKLIWKT